VPDVLLPAPSGRSKCRACGGVIAKGELRFGEEVTNPFTEGLTTLWFHLDCAALRRPEKARPLLAEHPDPIDSREELLAEAELGILHPRLCRIAKLERAKSGRAHCRHCKELIQNGALRIALEIFDEGRFNPMGYLHATCSRDYFSAIPSARRLGRPALELDEAARAELADIFADTGALPPPG
jgi:hypothetical protein